MGKCIPALRGYSWERKGQNCGRVGAQKTQECVYPEVSESSSESTFPIKRYTGQTVAATKTGAQDTPRLPLFRATEPGGALKAVISESIDPGGSLCREPGALSKPGPGSGWRAATGSGVLGDRGRAEFAASGCPKVEVRGRRVGAGPTRARSGDAKPQRFRQSLERRWELLPATSRLSILRLIQSHNAPAPPEGGLL